MFEIDFLPIESPGGAGSASGDAICLRFAAGPGARQIVVVIDGGYTDIGAVLAKHVATYYHTNRVDLMISTHPDEDHLNGLITAMKLLDVRELLMHQPRLHATRLGNFSNLAKVDELLALARGLGVRVTEPFTGLMRFGGCLRILGPTEAYYEDLLRTQLTSSKTREAIALARSAPWFLKGRSTLAGTPTWPMPAESLTDEDDTSERNASSVITLVQVDGRNLLFTGDAGVRSLELAADEYEAAVGEFVTDPLAFFQAPHHGSHHNLGPSILDRMLGAEGAPHRQSLEAFISSAAADEDHPSPKVINALTRRGCEVFATEGRSIMTGSGWEPRPTWTTLAPYGPLDEGE